jgi:hypothetical protein
LTTYSQRLENDKERPSESCASRHASKHIDVVQSFVRAQVSHAVDAEAERNFKGYATFDMLWLLYKPGSDCYVDEYNYGEHNPYVVDSVEVVTANGRVASYMVKYWYIDANSEWVGPAPLERKVDPFEGEKRITELQGFPCEYLKFMNGIGHDAPERVKKHFIERGKKWFGLRRQPACYSFDGVSTTFPRRTVSL